jgi:GT2 family glycosyltransferase
VTEQTVDVLVVIVTYNSAEVIGNLLDSLPAALDGLQAEVIVVDNGSADATLSVIESRPDCHVLRSTNTGYAGGINRGVAAGPASRSILVLNPDAELTPGSVEVMYQALNRPSVGIVAPMVRGSDGGLEHSLRREPTLLRATGLGRSGHPRFCEHMANDEEYVESRVVDWALGAVLLVSRGCYDALGGWDATYFLHSEETDFCLRARDAGWTTFYEASVHVVHLGKRSGYSSAVHAMQTVNRVRLYRRRHRVVASYAYYGLIVLGELSWLVRGHALSRVALVALIRPSRRPPELACSDRLVPL